MLESQHLFELRLDVPQIVDLGPTPMGAPADCDGGGWSIRGGAHAWHRRTLAWRGLAVAQA